MTKKNFEAMARIFRADLAVCGTDAERERVRCLVLSMSDYFASQNALFNRQIFLTACGF